MSDICIPKRCMLPRKAPLPIFESGQLKRIQCTHFMLKYDGCNVIVNRWKDMESLYTLGFFGKGSLSQGYPSYKMKMNDQNSGMNDFCELDTNEEEEVGSKTLTDVKNNRSYFSRICLKKTDPQIVEELHLMLEEAFFLSFALNCGSVFSKGQILDNYEVWKLFQNKQPDFIQRYIAYHHFRSKGWVIRSGIKYGADYTLYKQGPPFYHASFNVFVISNVSEENDKKIKLFVTSCRISEIVKKSLLLCRVQIPKNLPKGNLDTIKLCQVLEYKFTRWVASENRDKRPPDTVELRY